MKINELVDELLFIEGNGDEAQSKWIDKLSMFQRNGGTLSETTNRNGWQLIHIAAANGLIDVVKWLVDNGIDINMRDEYGYTPLIHSFTLDIDNAIQYREEMNFWRSCRLLELGAAIEVESDTGISIDSIAKDYGEKIYSLYESIFKQSSK